MTDMFSKPKPVYIPAASAPAPIPEPKPAAPMPDTSSASVQEERRAAEQRTMKRAGRASTILTAPGDRGRDTYSGTTLGSGA